VIVIQLEIEKLLIRKEERDRIKKENKEGNIGEKKRGRKSWSV
jgi:hypothetical protein